MRLKHVVRPSPDLTLSSVVSPLARVNDPLARVNDQASLGVSHTIGHAPENGNLSTH